MDAAALHALLAEHTARANLPGASVAVLAGGEVLTAQTGVCDVTTQEPIAERTAFPIASVTKPMVATAIAILAGDGALDIDDPVTRHVPELRRAPWAEAITIRHALAHRSGIPLSAAREFGFDDREEDALARFCESLAGDEPFARAGETWGYSNTGYCVLGRAIETASGRPWLDAMRTLLFEPLGMRATGARRTARHAVKGHLQDGEASTPVEAWESPGLGPGGAVLWSTAADLIAFARAHVDDDRFAPLREPAESPRIWPWMDTWCHGWSRLDWPGGPVWGWDGVTSGARAQLRIVPGRGAVALLANGDRGRALYWSLTPILMAELFAITHTPPPPRTPTPDLSAFEGIYAWPDLELRIEAREDHLQLTQGGTVLDAFPTGERTFTVAGASPDPVTITFADRGDPIMYWVVWPYLRRA